MYIFSTFWCTHWFSCLRSPCFPCFTIGECIKWVSARKCIIKGFHSRHTFVLYSSLCRSVLAVGLQTLFFKGTLTLSFMFLDPVDNDEYHTRFVESAGFDIGVSTWSVYCWCIIYILLSLLLISALGVALQKVLIVETNEQSLRFSNSLDLLPKRDFSSESESKERSNWRHR